MGIIKSWSFSSKKEFDTCPYKFHHKLILKTPKPPEPEDSPLKRGLAMHKLAENYMNGDSSEVPEELIGMKHVFEDAYTEAHNSTFRAEEPWAFTSRWRSTDWYGKDVWLRMALDLQIGTSGESTRIVDFKTGKKDGNELSHMIQGQLYAVGALVKNPELQEASVEFWYLDHGTTTRKVWKRKQIETLHKRWNAIGKKITSVEILQPTPTKFGCKYCAYNSACDYALRKEDL